MISRVRSLFQTDEGINRNIKLYLLTMLLVNIGFGVIEADFNLYILSMDMSPDFLGVILSLTPFAQVLAAIPIGFLAEKIGSKRSLIGLGTSLWLSFASSVATKRSRTATSAWLEITFQVGFIIAALGGGHLIARRAYPALGIISSVSMLIAYILTNLFFGKKYLPSPSE